MEFDELLITTGVDALVRLVREKQKIELSVAARLLNISPTTLEEWAHILEDEGIIKIDYSLTKIFLSWITPSEEKIEEEKQKFYQEKGGVVKEVEELRSRLEPEIKGLDDFKTSFSKFYESVAPKLEKLSKEIGSAGLQSDSGFFQNQKAEAAKVDEKLSMLEYGIKALKNDLDSTKIEMAAGAKSKEFIEKIQEALVVLNKRFEDLSKKALQYQSEVPTDFPSIAAVRQKFEAIKKDFDNIKNSNAQLRDGLLGIQESSDILKEVESSISKYEDEISKTKSELQALSQSAEKLMTKSTEISERVKKSTQTFEHFADSLETAKGILYRFPSQDEVGKELARIKKVEDSIAEKIKTVSQLLADLPDVKDLSKEFAEIRKDAEEKQHELESRTEEVLTALEEGSSTYATFEKIKERTLLSIQSYNAQLKAVTEEISQIRKSNADALAGVEKAAASYQDKVKKSDVKDVLKNIEDINSKKAIVDEIKTSLDSVSESAENLTRRLNLLSKEASILELRSGSGTAGSPAQKEEKEKEVVTQLKLTKQEEEDFSKKREELRDLIKKLWEQG